MQFVERLKGWSSDDKGTIHARDADNPYARLDIGDRLLCGTVVRNTTLWEYLPWGGPATCKRCVKAIAAAGEVK